MKIKRNEYKLTLKDKKEEDQYKSLDLTNRRYLTEKEKLKEKVKESKRYIRDE